MKVTTTFTPGIGWQYVLSDADRLVGRFGNFETEAGAKRAGDDAAQKWGKLTCAQWLAQA
jgi:hypothetical protein